MTRFFALNGFLFLVLVLMAGAPNAQEQPEKRISDKGPAHHVIAQPGEIQWKDGPASLEPGAQFAILEGNPGKAEVFTMRIRMPDGFRIAPHSHPNVERVTVISGTFHLGTGKQFDKAAAKPLEAGSYTSMPPGMHHYVVVKGETIVQLTSVGPWEIDYVNAKDDPRNRATTQKGR